MSHPRTLWNMGGVGWGVIAFSWMSLEDDPHTTCTQAFEDHAQALLKLVDITFGRPCPQVISFNTDRNTWFFKQDMSQTQGCVRACRHVFACRPYFIYALCYLQLLVTS